MTDTLEHITYRPGNATLPATSAVPLGQPNATALPVSPVVEGFSLGLSKPRFYVDLSNPTDVFVFRLDGYHVSVQQWSDGEEGYQVSVTRRDPVPDPATRLDDLRRRYAPLAAENPVGAHGPDVHRMLDEFRPLERRRRRTMRRLLGRG